MVAQEEDLALIERREGGRAVNLALGYPITVGTNLLRETAGYVRARTRSWVILCDAHPAVLSIARKLARMLGGGGAVPVVLGERKKRFATLERVLEVLLERGLDRSSIVIGVGGGIASDLFGFAAATYMRGVGYVHVATSLVAMADAAIGGKTGLDLRGGKNLAGVFRDPLAVFCELQALQTLPFRNLREGLAEIVKAGIIEGDVFFEMLETLAPHRFSRWPWLEVVAGAVDVKAAIVADDRIEAGAREALNLGHTFAHAIERASGYRVTHGAAVALGLRAAGLLALRTRRFSAAEHLRVLTLLALLGMPLRTALDPHAVFAAMSSDKKRRDGRLRFVLPRAIGDVEYGVGATAAAVLETLRRLQRVPETV